MENQKLISFQLALQFQARNRAYLLLVVIQGLVKDYEIDMGGTLSAEVRDAYFREYGCEPESKIREDVRRLQNFTLGLEAALDSGKANNLLEACNVLRAAGQEEMIATLNEILVSDYSGFQAMKTLIEAGRLSEAAYWEDSDALHQLWDRFAAAPWPHSLAAVASICDEEAIAI
jgi:hypothetical protein